MGFNMLAIAAAAALMPLAAADECWINGASFSSWKDDHVYGRDDIPQDFGSDQRGPYKLLKGGDGGPLTTKVDGGALRGYFPKGAPPQPPCASSRRSRPHPAWPSSQFAPNLGGAFGFAAMRLLPSSDDFALCLEPPNGQASTGRHVPSCGDLTTKGVDQEHTTAGPYQSNNTHSLTARARRRHIIPALESPSQGRALALQG